MDHTAARDLDLDVREGELVCLLGPSGCGKSTLLHLLGVVDAPSSGTLRIDGADVATLDVGAAYAHVFQEDRTVSERDGKVFQQRPLSPCPEGCGGRAGVVANAGRFTSGFDQLALTLNLGY